MGDRGVDVVDPEGDVMKSRSALVEKRTNR
jgi:hypothetical protein